MSIACLPRGTTHHILCSFLQIVAVKVQRPYVLETVTIDLAIIRSLGLLIRKYAPALTERADVVALLDEWASR